VVLEEAVCEVVEMRRSEVWGLMGGGGGVGCV
jgi:hypothetical protein